MEYTQTRTEQIIAYPVVERDYRQEEEHQAYVELIQDLRRYQNKLLLVNCSAATGNINLAYSLFNCISANWAEICEAVASSGELTEAKTLVEKLLPDELRDRAVEVALETYFEVSAYLTTQLTTLLGEKLLIGQENLPAELKIHPKAIEFAKRNAGFKQIEFSVGNGTLLPYNESLLLSVLAGSRKRFEQMQNEREAIEVANQELLLELLRGKETEIANLRNGDIVVEYSPPYYDYQPGTMVRLHVFRLDEKTGERRFETTQLQLPHLAEDDQNFYTKIVALSDLGVEVNVLETLANPEHQANQLLARPALLRGAHVAQVAGCLAALAEGGEGQHQSPKEAQDDLNWIRAHDSVAIGVKQKVFEHIKPLTTQLLSYTSMQENPTLQTRLANNLRTSILLAEISYLPQSVLHEQNIHLTLEQVQSVQKRSGELISLAAGDAESATQALHSSTELAGFSYSSGSDCTTSTLQLPAATKQENKLLTQALQISDAAGKKSSAEIGYYAGSKEWVCTCGKKVDTCHVNQSYTCSSCGVPLGEIKRIYADTSIQDKGSAVSDLLSKHYAQDYPDGATQTAPIQFDSVGKFFSSLTQALVSFFLPIKLQPQEET